MTFQEKVILLVVLVVVFTIAENMIRRKLKLSRQPFFAIYRPLNNFHKWIELVFLIGLLISFIIVNQVLIPYLLIAFFILLQLFRMVMEWKYNRKEKEYIMHGVGVIFFSFFMAVIVNL
ncbi:DUF4181 domain-containing protein [Bacillus sp. PAMC26568]|nr:DUF4181 domain-containing protein [Bacillus sp. PAMC26568]